MVHLEFWQAAAMGNKTGSNKNNSDRKNNIKQHSNHRLKVEPHLSRSVRLPLAFWLGEILIDLCQIVS